LLRGLDTANTRAPGIGLDPELVKPYSHVYVAFPDTRRSSGVEQQTANVTSLPSSTITCGYIRHTNMAVLTETVF